MNTISESTPGQTARDIALDFVKGFLVEIMVIYHIFNYYFNTRPPVLLYISFVTGSFVFITGYLVTSVYIQKYNSDFRKIFIRLFLRGGKLLLLFLFINISIYSMSIKNYNGYEFKLDQFIANFDKVLLAGSAKISAFELLVPIAYTLIVCSILVLFAKQKLIVPLITVLLLGVSIFVNQNDFFNLFYIGIGLSGVAFGCFTKDIRRLSNIKWVRVLSVIPVIIYYLLIHISIRENIFFHLFGIISILFCVYSFAGFFKSNNILTSTFDVFGKYTLICYLSQILFLQILFRTIGSSLSTAVSLVVAFIATNLFIYILCYLIRWFSSTNKYFNRAYLLIFG